MSDQALTEDRFGEAATAMAHVAPKGAPSQSTMVEQARAIADVRAAIAIARDYPRSEAEAVEEMRRACSTKELAEVAFYRVDRGGTMATGPSIDLARELARCYRNITSGHKEVGRDHVTGESEVLAFAWDMEKNNRREQTIIVPHKRGKNRAFDGGTIREIIAGYAARVEREMILACLPVWFRVQAIDLCHKVLAEGDGTKTLEQRIADCKAMFYGIDIMADALERKIGRPATEWAPEDLAVLAVVYKSIRRGESSKDQEFPPLAPAPPEKKEGASKLDALEGVVEKGAKTEDKPDPELPHAHALAAEFQKRGTVAEVDDLAKQDAVKRQMARWKKEKPALWNLVDQAAGARKAELDAASAGQVAA